MDLFEVKRKFDWRRSVRFGQAKDSPPSVDCLFMSSDGFDLNNIWFIEQTNANKLDDRSVHENGNVGESSID